MKCRKMAAVNSLCLVPYGSFNSCVCTNFPDDQPCDTDTRTKQAETMDCFRRKKNVIKTIGNAFFFIFRGEFTKNELCLLIALFICTVCIVLVSDSVKELCKLGNCTKCTHKICTERNFHGAIPDFVGWRCGGCSRQSGSGIVWWLCSITPQTQQSKFLNPKIHYMDKCLVIICLFHYLINSCCGKTFV